ncbi:hypothetical protein CVO74_00905 [Xanthomonas prunicola]|uniref:Uncharacterized protein n=1 Tax=Xanthomonas prunicola TaxID=2053930 RepID=A0A2N3RPS6_9XANT|nr:hypothetical protein XpruCFBP8353_05550 [Xanthomonas prunicola]PKV18788.1 hypothetical protein XpruCFBP8354_05550 [Xanthomonas prunicola]PKV21904.1 hypothetical protein CVO74_00905 [Xanthomonas prunicola]
MPLHADRYSASRAASPGLSRERSRIPPRSQSRCERHSDHHNNATTAAADLRHPAGTCTSTPLPQQPELKHHASV